MTATHWTELLFTLGVILILAGAWTLTAALGILGVALILPMPALAYYVRNME
ncbi:hypothetical protein [Cryobacterium sp. Y57]|uniref:hypothetical protein n=1 Tax=Cryobacterium sp. Y57 TaxID=2048287 RepID=UPI00130481F3|nr:hypothetical protein [Cryobacterium sp. Y57]